MWFAPGCFIFYIFTAKSLLEGKPVAKIAALVPGVFRKGERLFITTGFFHTGRQLPSYFLCLVTAGSCRYNVPTFEFNLQIGG